MMTLLKGHEPHSTIYLSVPRVVYTIYTMMMEDQRLVFNKLLIRNSTRKKTTNRRR